MLLTKIVFTVICFAVLIVLAYLTYYVLHDKNFEKSTPKLVQYSSCIIVGSLTGCVLGFIYDIMIRFWFS